MLDAMQASPPPPPRAATDAVVIYSRPGCHLCEDALTALTALLRQRAASGRRAPAIVQRDITTDPQWEREFLVTIPVIDVGGHRLELATSPARIRALLEAALDGVEATTPGAASGGGAAATAGTDGHP